MQIDNALKPSAYPSYDCSYQLKSVFTNYK